MTRPTFRCGVTYDFRNPPGSGLTDTAVYSGILEQAVLVGQCLRGLVAAADEPRPKAEAARLLAEIALRGGHLSNAEAHLDEAHAAIQTCELPLVEWRLFTTAARLHERQHRRASGAATVRCPREPAGRFPAAGTRAAPIVLGASCPLRAAAPACDEPTLLATTVAYNRTSRRPKAPGSAPARR